MAKLEYTNIDYEIKHKDTMIVYYWENNIKYSLCEISECGKMTDKARMDLIVDVLENDLDYEVER